MKRVIKSGGFTLVELLTALALMAVLFTMCSVFFGYALNIYIREGSMSQAEQDAIYALQQVEKEIRAGRLMVDSINPSDVSTLSIKSTKPDGEIITIKPGYSNGKKVLNREVSNSYGIKGTNKIIDNIDSIMFSYDNNDNNDVVSVGTWVLIFILLAIPIVNIIGLLIMAFGQGNANLKNFAKASLILMGISLVLIIMVKGCGA
jgi:prepilin-type N-terminal cleavage/methylation domain-containing protein